MNLRFDWDLDFGTLTSITGYRDMDDKNDSWGWASDKVGTASYLEVLGFGDNPSEQFSQEFRIAGGNDSIDWVGGVYYFEEKSTNTLEVPLFRGVTPPDCAVWPIYCLDLGPAGTLGSFASGLQFFGSRIQAVEAENSSVAVFGEVTWRFMQDWSVTAGMRYTEDTREFHRSQVLAAGVGAFQTSTAQLDPGLICPDGSSPSIDQLAGISGPMTCYTDADFSQVTPRVIFSYDVSDTVMLYGGWSKGWRQDWTNRRS